MPLDAAQWQIQITAADKTAAAFSSLQKRIDDAAKRIDELGKGSPGGGLAAGLEKALGSAGSAVLRYTKVLAPAAVAAYAFKQSMQFAEISEQADALGISADAFQAYRSVAQEAGVTNKQFDGTLQELNAAMASASLGNADAVAKFEKLGVKILDAKDKMRPLQDILPEVARGLLNISDESERAAAAQGLFTSTSSRVLALLPQLSTGSRELTDIARQQGKVLTGEAVEGWAKMNAQLELLKTNADVAIGVLATPFVAAGFEKLNELLRDIIVNLDRVKREGATAAQRTAQAAAVGDVKQLEDQLAAARQKQANLRPGSTGYNLEQSSIDGLTRRIDAARAAETVAKQATYEAEDAYARSLKLPMSAPAATTGAGNPRVPPGTAPSGGGAATGEDSAERRLGVLTAERQALERAMAAFTTQFDIRQNDSVAEVEKRLQRSVDLEKQIATLTKNVSKDSPVAQQMASEATAISDLNAKWEEYRKVVVGAESTIAKYGDGSKELARVQAELNKQLAAGKITQEEYSYAMKDAAEKAKQQELSARGAAGGFGAFTAGMESALRPASQMSREFQYGQKAVQLFDDAIAQMVQNGQVNFQQLLGSFVTMLAQMEMRAAMSSLWGAFGGSAAGGGAGGILGGIINLFGGGGGVTAADPTGTMAVYNMMPSSYTLPGFAEGGRPTPGQLSIVGENGPELFVPDSAGTIFNQDQLSGGGDAVQISMNNSFGGGVTHAEMLRYGAMIEERAKAGAMAGIEAKRKRGGAIKQVFRA